MLGFKDGLGDFLLWFCSVRIIAACCFVASFASYLMSRVLGSGCMLFCRSLRRWVVVDAGMSLGRYPGGGGASWNIVLLARESYPTTFTFSGDLAVV